jgi:hypothetical protein
MFMDLYKHIHTLILSGDLHMNNVNQETKKKGPGDDKFFPKMQMIVIRRAERMILETRLCLEACKLLYVFYNHC